MVTKESVAERTVAEKAADDAQPIETVSSFKSLMKYNGCEFYIDGRKFLLNLDI